MAAQEAAAEVLAESGVAELEARVLAFLYRHSGALRLLATIDDAAQLLLQARPQCTATSSHVALMCLHAMCCCLEQRYDELRSTS